MSRRASRTASSRGAGAERPPPEPRARSSARAGWRGARPTLLGARRRCLWLGRAGRLRPRSRGRLVKAHGGFAAVLAPAAGDARSGRCAPRHGPPAGEVASRSHPPGLRRGVVAWCDDANPPRVCGSSSTRRRPVYCAAGGGRRCSRRLRPRPTVAIVGARRPSPYGLEMAWLLGAGLARAGVNVVSGMALGIDAQAHVGALEGLGEPRERPNDGVATASRWSSAGVLGAGVGWPCHAPTKSSSPPSSAAACCSPNTAGAAAAALAIPGPQPPDRRPVRRRRHRRGPRYERRPAHGRLRPRPRSRRAGRARRGRAAAVGGSSPAAARRRPPVRVARRRPRSAAGSLVVRPPGSGRPARGGPACARRCPTPTRIVCRDARRRSGPASAVSPSGVCWPRCGAAGTPPTRSACRSVCLPAGVGGPDHARDRWAARRRSRAGATVCDATLAGRPPR